MPYLWDIRKHSCELAMSFEQLHLDFDSTIETWLAGTSYTQSEKDKFLSVYDDCSKISVNDRKCKCFVKAESYPEFKYPRPIKSRTDRFKTVMGPLFQGINDCLFKKTEWFIKKIPVDERPSHIIEALSPYQSILCTDYSSFEAHFIDVWIHCIEFPLYNWMTWNLPHAKEWRNELHTLLKSNSCLFKDFKLECMSRASGEMNTSSGNGFSNLALYTYVARIKGATKMLGKFEGDDAITNTYPPESEPETIDFTNLGWTCKLDRHLTISEASFCGIVADETDKINISDIRNYLLDFGWTKQQYVGANSTTIKSLIRAKGYSAIFQYPNCPIIDSLGRYALRITDEEYVRSKFAKMYRNNQFADNRFKQEQFKELFEKYSDNLPKKKEIPMNTRLLVEKLYDISVIQQIQSEEYLDKLTTIQPLTLPIKYNEVHYYCWEQYTSCDKEFTTEPQKEIQNFKEFCQGWNSITIDL